MTRYTSIKEGLLLSVFCFLPISCQETLNTDPAESDSGYPSDNEQDTKGDNTDAEGDTGVSGSFSLSTTRVVEDISVLASDAMDGRETGTIGNENAMAHVVAQFEQIGLDPAGDDDSYLQHFTYPEWREKKLPSMIADDEALTPGIDFDVLRYSRSRSGTGKIVFVGNSIVIPAFNKSEYPDCPYPEAGHNELEGLDLTSALLLRFAALGLGEIPLEERCPVSDVGAIYDEAKILGLALISGFQLGSFADLVAGATLQADNELPYPVLYLSPELARAFIEDIEYRYWDIRDKKIASLETEISVTIDIDVEKHTGRSANVLGVIRGDKKIDQNVLIVGAHLDHVGSEIGFQIVYNGADDNASGIAVVLELARATAALPTPPRRTIVFAAWNAEECGIFGSCYYATHPVYPLSNTLVHLNLDSVGAGDGTGVYLFSGAEPQNTWFSELMISQSEEAGYTHSVMPTERIDASDHKCFFAEGVTAVTLQTSGFHPVTHTRNDTIQELCEECIRAALETSWAALTPLLRDEV